MATEIVMPKLGMVMTEGTVSKWNRSQGEDIAQGEVVLEIETEKLNYELEATTAGKLHPIVPEGAIIPVNGLLGYLLAEGESPQNFRKMSLVQTKLQLLAKRLKTDLQALNQLGEVKLYLPHQVRGN